MKKKTYLYIGIIALLFIIMFVWLYSSPGFNGDILAINLKEHINLAMHIHPYLEIEILGKNQVIPTNIGISNYGMRTIHTHDNTGKIHLESPYPYKFHMKDFFSVWEKTFNSNCIFEYCADEKHELLFFVNDLENTEYENLALNDGDKIRIVYKEK